MAELHVRQATAADAEAIAKLLDQLGYPTESADVPERLDRLTRHGGACVLLAHQGLSVVGLASVHILGVLNRSPEVAWLTALVVDESVRRSGIGRRLVTAVEAFARAAGCERLSVTTHEHLRDAREFYVQVGFTPTGRRFGKVLSP